jgi:hypothetical protein
VRFTAVAEVVEEIFSRESANLENDLECYINRDGVVNCFDTAWHGRWRETVEKAKH